MNKAQKNEAMHAVSLVFHRNHQAKKYDFQK